MLKTTFHSHKRRVKIDNSSSSSQCNFVLVWIINCLGYRKQFFFFTKFSTEMLKVRSFIWLCGGVSVMIALNYQILKSVFKDIFRHKLSSEEHTYHLSVYVFSRYIRLLCDSTMLCVQKIYKYFFQTDIRENVIVCHKNKVCPLTYSYYWC